MNLHPVVPKLISCLCHLIRWQSEAFKIPTHQLLRQVTETVFNQTKLTYLCQVQGSGCDCRETLHQWDSVRTFRQSDTREDRIPVEQLLVMSC